MTTALAGIMRQFLAREIDAQSFVTTFQAAWKQRRDAGCDSDQNSEVFDRAFTAADCYSPVLRNHWEIDADQLRFEIAELEKLITA